MPCHLLLAKLAAAAPGPVLASLDKLVGPLEKTLTARLRGEPVKQEVCVLLAGVSGGNSGAKYTCCT